MMDQSPKKKLVSINFSCAVFFLLDFLSPQDGNDWFSQNVRKESPLRADISEEWRSHMTILRCGPWFGSAWSGSE
jgi:hypothetical protein